MSKFSLDYDALSDQVEKKRFKLSEVRHRLEKVAFDVVRFKDGEPEQLWQIQNGDDGDYIVALYEGESELSKEAAWGVRLSKTAAAVHVFYKGEPMVKLAAAKLGIPEGEIEMLPKYLPRKLASNSNLVKALLGEMSPAARDEFIRKYPELA